MKDRRLIVRGAAEQVEICTGTPHAMLCDPVQRGCEICSKASVYGTQKLHFAAGQDLLDNINAEPGFSRK
ncbi:hypothetical protein TNCV_2671781 [Trichonephila clavipes]|nr:hypothetical protein TNCV_2671781 [Trichonephila clavipes]